MNKFDKNFHINFSPMYLAVAVMIMFLVAFNLKADGNTTAHGIVLSDEEIAQAKKDLAPELVSMPYTVVDKATIVVGNYGIQAKLELPCDIKTGDIVVPEKNPIANGVRLVVVKNVGLPDEVTYTCRVYNIMSVMPIKGENDVQEN